MLNELQNVRMELGTIQQKTLKATALRAVDNVTDKINLAKDKEKESSTEDSFVLDKKNNNLF